VNTKLVVGSRSRLIAISMPTIVEFILFCQAIRLSAPSAIASYWHPHWRTLARNHEDSPESAGTGSLPGAAYKTAPHFVGPACLHLGYLALLTRLRPRALVHHLGYLALPAPGAPRARPRALVHHLPQVQAPGATLLAASGRWESRGAATARDGCCRFTLHSFPNYTPSTTG
jgi:hypothetical protein